MTIEINGIDATEPVVDVSDNENMLVSEELSEWIGWSFVKGNTVYDALDSIDAHHEWDGVGFFVGPDMYPVLVDVDTGDYGTAKYAGMHECDMAVDIANWKHVSTELADINSKINEYVVWDNILFYNLGNKDMVQFVTGCEKALSDYSLLDESKFFDVEQTMADKAWENSTSRISFESDGMEKAVRGEWVNCGTCAECGTAKVGEVAESLGYLYCDFCENVTESPCTECD